MFLTQPTLTCQYYPIQLWPAKPGLENIDKLNIASQTTKPKTKIYITYPSELNM